MPPLSERIAGVHVPIYVQRFAGKNRYEVRVRMDGRGKSLRKRFSEIGKARAYARKSVTSLFNGLHSWQRLSPRQADQGERWIALCAEHQRDPEEVLLALREQWRAAQQARLERAPLVKDVVAEFLAEKAHRKLGAYHLRDLQTRLGKFAAAFGEQINAFGRKEIQKWLDGLKLAPRTWNNYRACLVDLFTFAKGRRYVPADWSELDSKITLEDQEVVIYTPAELRRILEAASPPRFQILLAIGAFAGIRSEEITKLQWEDFDWDAGWIFLRRKIVKGKVSQKKQRQVPISDNLVEWLAPHRQAAGPVCTYKNPKVVAGLKTKLAERLDITWAKNALRKSWISYQLALTQDASKVARWAGNSPTVITAHYERLVTPEKAQEWFALTPPGPQRMLAFPAMSA